MSGGHYSLFGSLRGNMGNFRYLLLACGFLAIAGSSNGGVLRDDCLLLVEQYFKNHHHEPEVHDLGETLDFGHHGYGHGALDHVNDYHVINPVIEEVVAPFEETVIPEIECYYPQGIVHARPSAAANIVVPAVTHEIEMPLEKVVEEELPHVHGHHQYVPQVLPYYHYVPKEHEVITESTSAANIQSWGNKHVTVGLVPESSPHRHLSVGVELPSTTAHVPTVRPVTVTPHVTVAPHTAVTPHTATATAIVDAHTGSSVVNVPPIAGSMLCVFVPSDTSVHETCIPSSMLKQYISAHGHATTHGVAKHHHGFPHFLNRSPISLFRH